MIKITERTLYEPISDFLEKELGAHVMSEVRLENGFIDILFELYGFKFIIEIKIGRSNQALTKAVAQAFDYASQLNNQTRNILAIVFPDLQSGQPISDSEIENFGTHVLNSNIEGYIHTEYLDKFVHYETFKSVLLELRDNFRDKKVEVDFDSIVKAMREIVQDLYEVIRQSKTDEIFEEVAEKLDLFAGIGEIKDKNKAKSQVSMLSSYLLFNQLLFYQVYKIKSKDSTLPELSPIKNIKEIKRYLDAITNIDYRPIYNIDLIDKIPNTTDVIEILNRVIKNLIVLRAEYVTKDLAGRFFHALLPHEVAKVWAAFYTNTTAAELLATLAIDHWDESILDPSCGSGTLLSACYNRKLELAHKKEVNLNDNKLHKKFLEEDITGMDIMPFAAHLTAINLALQRLDQPTDIVRIATKDSILELAPKILANRNFNKKGILIEPFSKEIQSTLTGEQIILHKSGAVSAKGIGKGFQLKQVDLVIMNPPFSDREKLPDDYRNKLKKSKLAKTCGNSVNLWGYFLALSDLLLKPGGEIAAVIPINIARGKATQKIRNFILENYFIKYLIIAMKDFAFSENSDFRDILLLAEKRKANLSDKTKIIFLNISIKDCSNEDIVNIVKNANSKSNYSDNLIKITSINYKDILESKENLMRFLSPAKKDIYNFVNKYIYSPNLILIPKKTFPEGFHVSPKGLSQLLFITSSNNINRSKRAFMLLDKVDLKTLNIRIKNTSRIFKIKKKFTYPAIRTITSQYNLEIKNLDYFINEKFENFDIILGLSKWNKKEKINWHKIKSEAKSKMSFLFLPERFNPYSPNTSLIAFFSSNKIVCPHTIRIGKNFDLEASKIESIFLNSSFFISEFLINKEETSGQYTHLMESDLILMKMLKVESLSNKQKNKILNLFDRIKDLRFPSLIEQFKNKFWARIEIDKTITNILGKELTDEELNKIYKSIIIEIETMVNFTA